MKERAAIDTIKGYFYQFDHTIASLLDLESEEDKVTIEGVEDVDISMTSEEVAIQCKYYAKTEYNHSIIAEPIRLMLDHFKEYKTGGKTKLSYKIRGYYKSGQHKLNQPIELQFLKDNFLTFVRTERINGVDTKVKHVHYEDLGINDHDLTEFLSLLEIDINAKDFDAQYLGILTTLKERFNCSSFAAEYFYYNNALAIIRKLSKEALLKNRRISKKDFLLKIDSSKILFNEWFVKIRGEKDYLASLRREYFGSLNILYKERFFLCDANFSDYSRNDIKDIIAVVIKKFTKIHSQPTPFCPYIYLHGISAKELIEIKTDLIEDGLIIHDGFEFEGSSFNASSLINRKPSLAHQIKIKFLNRIQHLNEVIHLIGKRCEVYQFYKEESFFELNNQSVKEINIQIKQLKNIKNIL